MSAAQEEFDRLVATNTGPSHTERNTHPEDRGRDRDDDYDDLDEEERYRAAQVDAAMRMPTFGSEGAGGAVINLPPPSFDSGRATGVKGVIADARSYETAKQAKWKSRVRQARRSVLGMGGLLNSAASTDKSESGGSADEHDDDADGEFLQQWRESRRRELEAEAQNGPAIRNRRTSPSVRMFGRFDEVDAMGYLDAIEKVGRDTVVAVFVYDNECEVSAEVEAALRPLVTAYPAVHFVKVHYDDIEFDNAAVPAILAYRNQGDLIANLTGIIEMIPENEDFNSESLKKIFKKHNLI
ncbi:hypothetical protein PpBr36_03578 [Pyricularia pennisetigena]|uniref:hypothetical protein n=1 Tax=Pyricularia pennisetigena TaxID=1578925 RepID=UPI00114EC521|nr:hypothetical protein PpBr36_03578 [Pyricularia pennisetigena]TLS30709.1 hypothetical protein PpBr36_03578 [Pyricularia pennisetigena]